MGAVCLLFLFCLGCAGTIASAPRGDRQHPPQHLTECTKSAAGKQRTVFTRSDEEKNRHKDPESGKQSAQDDQGLQISRDEKQHDPSSIASGKDDQSSVQKDSFSFTPARPKAESSIDDSEESPQEKITLNFDNAELSEVIQVLAGILEINYLMDPGIGGNVTIQTAGSLNRRDLFPVFYQILEANGLTAVPKDNIYRIVPIKDAARMPIASRLGSDSRTGSKSGRFMIQLVELDSIAASEMAKVLEPFISANGTIVTLEDANVLMVVDQPENVDKVLRMVDTFDTDIFREVKYRFYPLQYADAESLANILGEMFKSYGALVEAKTKLIPITRLNALLVISSRAKVFDEIDGFVKEYDISSASTESGIYVYSVENGRAGEIADVLDKVFAGKSKSDEKDARDRTYRNPFAKEAVAERKQEQEERQQSGEENRPESAERPSASASGGVTISSGTLYDEVKITTDEVRNNLIIEATPSDYQVVRNLLKQIDTLPRQVLIEVTLAEVTLDRDSELGVEWTYLKGDENLSTSLLDATLGSSGLRYTIGKADRWTATMKTLASRNKVNILSSPSILASNSETAKIDISTEVPVASSQYEYTSGDNPVVSTNIEYRDTGVMLTVTPHINKNGIVTMEIAQEVSEQAESVQVGNLNYPSFFKRAAETILTVQSGQTIVIGGLIRENRSDGSSGVPWAVNIPVLKYIFGRTSKSFEKNELIILISPQVITSLDDVDVVTSEFKSKVYNAVDQSAL
jgi:general secretion pathway protein D